MSERIPSYIHELAAQIKAGRVRTKSTFSERTAIHECGHFVMAYAGGLKCTQLSIDAKLCPPGAAGLCACKSYAMYVFIETEIKGGSLDAIAKKFPDPAAALAHYHREKRRFARALLSRSVAGAVATNVLCNDCTKPSNADEWGANRMAKFLRPDDPWLEYDTASTFVASQMEAELGKSVRAAAVELSARKTLRGAEIDALWERVKPTSTI